MASLQLKSALQFRKLEWKQRIGASHQHAAEYDNFHPVLQRTLCPRILKSNALGIKASGYPEW